MKEHMVQYSFTRSGDDQEESVSFQVHRDTPWTEILPFFLDFLKANGYAIDSFYSIYEMCTYDHSVE